MGEMAKPCNIEQSIDIILFHARAWLKSHWEDPIKAKTLDVKGETGLTTLLLKPCTVK